LSAISQPGSKGACQRKFSPVDDSGQVLMDEYDKLLTIRSKIAAFTHVSNALGTVTPAREMIVLAHRNPPFFTKSINKTGIPNLQHCN
jgi:selenocysteine lyase/cysteine desulfurase